MNGTSQAVSKTKHLLTTTRSLLHHYATTKSLSQTQLLHASIITSGLLSSPHSTRILPLLTTAYAACGHLSHARKLFDDLPEPPLLVYNTMIRVCALNGLSYQALQLFVKMIELGDPSPDKFTFPLVVKVCGDLSLLELGISLHGLMVTSGFHLDTYAGNSLLAMYMRCGEMEMARTVFHKMQERSVVSWNTMISGYCQNGYAKKALLTFDEMVDAGVEPDGATMVSVLPACGHLKDLKCGKRVHKLGEEYGLGSRISVRNALIDMYVKCGSMAEAQLVFDKMVERDVVTWTTMMNGYILNGEARRALTLFPLMQLEGVRPNHVSVASLLSLCANSHFLKHGRCLHGWALRKNVQSDVSVVTALIDMYGKCNRIRASLQVFTRTSGKRTTPWNAILSCFNHNRLAREAIDLFKEMLSEAVQCNLATMNSLLPAYAMLADLQQALNIHGYLTRSGFLSQIEVATALIDTYSKCGSLVFAHRIFDGVKMKDKDIVCWSAIVSGYGMHGNGEVAVCLFNEMVESGVEPNEITFTSVLHACSHGGLVDEGLSLFKFMLEVQHTTPSYEHYTCIVDLLGRAGRVGEAYELIRTMPFEPNPAVWGALLGACVIHEDVELGELAAKWLFKLEPENTGNYVLMAKIYSAVGRWKDAENTRHMMNEVGLRKDPAHSLIEARNV